MCLRVFCTWHVPPCACFVPRVCVCVLYFASASVHACVFCPLQYVLYFAYVCILVFCSTHVIVREPIFKRDMNVRLTTARKENRSEYYDIINQSTHSLKGYNIGPQLKTNSTLDPKK